MFGDRIFGLFRDGMRRDVWYAYLLRVETEKSSYDRRLTGTDYFAAILRIRSLVA